MSVMVMEEAGIQGFINNAMVLDVGGGLNLSDVSKQKPSPRSVSSSFDKGDDAFESFGCLLRLTFFDLRGFDFVRGGILDFVVLSSDNCVFNPSGESM